MTFPTPPQPNWGYASAASWPTGRNWLALVSFLLSLAPVVDVLVFLLNEFAVLVLQAGVTVDNVFSAIELVVLAVSSIASITAIITGTVAMSRAKRYPPRQAWKGLATAGMVIGISGTVLLVCVGGGFALLVRACTSPTGPGC